MLTHWHTVNPSIAKFSVLSLNLDSKILSMAEFQTVVEFRFLEFLCYKGLILPTLLVGNVGWKS